jgi:hypothetical protein
MVAFGFLHDAYSLRSWARALLLAVVLPVLVAACAGPVRLSAVPEDRMLDGVIPDIPNARFWVDKEMEPYMKEAIESAEREKAYLASIGHTGPLPPAYFLAVSGGGVNVAFGAGLI